MIDRPTICGFCSCGCAVYVEPDNGRVVSVSPSEHHPVSDSRLCFKGWNATPAVMGAERLRTPLVRRNGKLEPASWRDAVEATASAIKRAGSDGVGIIGSAKTTNEECYSLAKLARAVIGTPHVDSACRFYDASILPALLDTTGLAASQTDLNSLRDAGSMLIVGANVMDQLPHVGSRIEDAVEAGCKVVTVDPRTSRLAVHTSLYLQPKPGTDLVWLRALLKSILDQKLFTDAAPELAGFEELRASLDDVQMSQLSTDCGLEPDAISEAAQTLAANKPLVVMFGLGAMQQPNSTQIVKALADIATLLGGSVMPLRGQDNAQGACDMGLLAEYLPGYAPISNTEARNKWEAAWNCKLPEKPGMTAAQMVQGDLAALLVFGENVALSGPDPAATRAVLDKIGFLAVCDLYLTETAQLADVVFPACSFLEKNGTFTNIERRVQRVRKVFEPVGESKSDLEIIADLAAALGSKLAREPAAVMVEIAANVPQYSGVSYEALETFWGNPWPAPPVQPRLAPITASRVEADAEFPFKLIASRINFHQQTGTMSSRCSILAREYPTSYAELNESDARELGVRPGRMLTITSKTGSLTRVLQLSDKIPPGCVHVPLFYGGDSPNALAPYEFDPASGVPVYKAVAVKVEAA